MEKSWVFHNFPEAPLPPPPPGTRTAAEEETASALLPRSLRFLKKEMKFLLTNEKLRSSSSSAGKNGKAPRPVFLAKRYRLAWKLRRRFRPLASDYTIFCFPQGKKSSRRCRNAFGIKAQSPRVFRRFFPEGDVPPSNGSSISGSSGRRRR